MTIACKPHPSPRSLSIGTSRILNLASASWERSVGLITVLVTDRGLGCGLAGVFVPSVVRVLVITKTRTTEGTNTPASPHPSPLSVTKTVIRPTDLSQLAEARFKIREVPIERLLGDGCGLHAIVIQKMIWIWRPAAMSPDRSLQFRPLSECQ